jgi:hypothetical protein
MLVNIHIHIQQYMHMMTHHCIGTDTVAALWMEKLKLEEKNAYLPAPFCVDNSGLNNYLKRNCRTTQIKTAEHNGKHSDRKGVSDKVI